MSSIEFPYSFRTENIVANSIDSKTKRDKLSPRREPYWGKIQAGCFVGFRKLADGAGTWIARWRDEAGKQHYHALDHQSDYDTAVAAARQWFQHCDLGATPQVLSVTEACKAYVAALLAEGRKDTASDATGRFNRLVYEKNIGKIQLDKLRPAHLENWMHDQIDTDDDPDELRRSKDSANRNLASLKAALNRALKQRMVATDAGWKTVEAFSKVAERRKDAFLSVPARRALLDACAPDLRLLLEAALLTGARPGEIARLNACDFDKRLGTLTLRGKTGERTVAISSAAADFFTQQTKNKIGEAPILTDAYGKRWNKDSWKDPFAAARDLAGLPNTVVLYSLRHTAISELILSGMDSFVVAKINGTSVQMIEQNYGHLRHSTVKAHLDKVSML